MTLVRLMELMLAFMVFTIMKFFTWQYLGLHISIIDILSETFISSHLTRWNLQAYKYRWEFYMSSFLNCKMMPFSPLLCFLQWFAYKNLIFKPDR